MKNFKLSLAYLAVFAMFFTSCSKEETGAIGAEDTVQLTFGSLLNDFENRQAVPGECSDGVPSYVAVGLTQDGIYVGGGTSSVHMINIDLKNNNGSWETVYSSELELPADLYVLEHFIVYDNNHNVLWVAPRVGGTFASYVDNPLPQNINLEAGTKPYISVDVLCYIAREEVAYGYPFFFIDVTEVENSFCLFVNYCDDLTGREYPAYFMVEVWSDSYGGQDLVLSQTNSITMAGNWPSASVLCFALPDLSDDEYYVRVTVLNHDLLGYTANESTDYAQFPITQADIDAQRLETPRYDHIRFNCGPPSGDPICEPGTVLGDTNGDCLVDCRDTNSCNVCDVPGDTNGDCVVNCLDEGQGPCDNDPYPNCQGTETFWMFGDNTFQQLQIGNKWGWAEFYDRDDNDQSDSFNLYAGAGGNNTNNGFVAGTVEISVENSASDPSVDIVEFTVMEGSGINLDKIDYYVGTGTPQTSAPGQFQHNGGVTGVTPVDGQPNTFTVEIPAGADFWIMIHGEACER